MQEREMSIDDYISKELIPRMFAELDIGRVHILESYLDNTPHTMFSSVYRVYVNGWYDIMHKIINHNIVPNHYIGNQQGAKR